MAGRYTITVIRVLAINEEVADILTGQPGVFLEEESIVRFYATRETAAVTIGITIAREVGLPVGSPVNISAVAGSLPSRQDDLILKTGGFIGNQLIVSARSTDGAATREVRVLVDVNPVEDEALLGGI